MSDDIQNLKNAIHDNEVVIFIGTGVSTSTIGNEQAVTNKKQEVSGWNGLLQHGLNKCYEFEWMSKKEFSYFNKKLQTKQAKISEYLAIGDRIKYCFEKLKEETQVDAYQKWLEETVGKLKANNPELIKAIGELGCQILTTNYDSLLEAILEKSPLTWDGLRNIKKNQFSDLKKYIIHVHGYFEKPHSVILDNDDYKRIREDKTAQSTLHGLMMTKNVLFIGYGAGMDDPNFSNLLEWRRDVGGEGSSAIYILVKSDKMKNSNSPSSVPSGPNIKYIPYGNKHEDLLLLIQKLKSYPRK